MEVVPGIHRIDAPLGDRVCAVYLLVGAERAVLIDTGVAGTVGDVVLPYAESIGLDPDHVKLVLVSHADVDHSGDTAAAIAAFPAALLACHRDDAAEVSDIELMIADRYGQFSADHGIADPPEATAWVRSAGRSVPVQLQFSGGERIRMEEGWEVEILHTPGHSRGHLTVWDPRSRAAITLDAVLGRTIATTAGKPAFPPTYRDVGPYRASIDAVAALDPAFILASHEPVMAGAAGKAFLDESREFSRGAEEHLLDILRDCGPTATISLLHAVGPRLGTWPVEAVLCALAFPIVGELEHSVRNGRVRAGRGPDGLITWEAIA